MRLERLRGLAIAHGDLFLALTLAGIAIGQVLTSEVRGGDRAVAAVVGVIVTSALAWRRRRMLLVALVIAAAVLAQCAIAEPPEAIWTLLTFIIAAYSAGAYVERRTGAVALVALGVAVSASILFDSSDNATNIPPTLAIFLLLPWAAGRAFDRRNREVVVLQRGQHQRELALIADERARIARELHDVVAHSLSVIAVQADAAEGALDIDPSRASAPLAAVKQTSREALVEMRALVGLLRTDGGPPTTAPSPGLDQLDALISTLGDAGLQVRLERDAALRTMPAGLGLSAYRIIQEGLTNVLKHAPRAAAVVTIREEAGSLDLSVEDDGVDSPAADDVRSGHGLIGMRERVLLYGGTLEAGPTATGGFRIGARFPLEGCTR